MKYVERNGEVEIIGVSDFDLVRIFECGQCFRWTQDESGVYTGVAMGRVVRVRTESQGGQQRIFISGTVNDFEKIWRDYFDIDRDYAKIRKQLALDDFMQKATEFGAGIRILRQDKWEALCSFIISQNNNIPRIRGIVEALCAEFGDEIEFEGHIYHTFPSAEKLATLSADKLAKIRCGYRAEYIIRAAKDVVSGKVNLETLAELSPHDARKELKKLHGVGDKVADCAVLFGLNILDAFPVDVWMERAITRHYGSDFDPKIFSPYAGIAQQYIFYYMRST